MANQLYRQENTVVLVQGTKVTDFPIVDSYFYYDEVPQSYTIKSVQSRKTASIPRADIGTYKNELDVAYTEQSLLSFLRLYCSLTDKIPASNPMIVLPSGTYTPKNSISSEFDLLWENQTANVTTGNGTVSCSVSSTFEEGASFKVNHYSDFELNFYFSTENLIAGVCYFKDNGITFNTYIGIDHSFLYQSGNAFVFGNGQTHHTEPGISFPCRFTIYRTGMVIDYKIDGVSVYSQTADFSNGFLFNCSIGAIGDIYDIELIIP